MGWWVIRIAHDGRGWMDEDVGARDIENVEAKRGGSFPVKFPPFIESTPADSMICCVGHCPLNTLILLLNLQCESASAPFLRVE